MKLLRKFRALFAQKKLDGEMAEEMRQHLERRTQANLAAGMAHDEARYAARRQFGPAEQLKEIAREDRGWRWLEQLLQDLRYALRSLARARGFAAVVILTLALGIGATTAIYSVVNAAVFNPVPGPDSEQLVQIGQTVRLVGNDVPRAVGASPPVLQAVEATPGFFSELTWCDPLQLEMISDEFPETAFGALAPVNFFAMLGIRPALGRTFAPDEAVEIRQRLPVGDTAIVISHAWWQTKFGSDPNVLGRMIELSGRRYTIVGVMPAHFQFPSSATLFWLPAKPVRPNPVGTEAPNLQLIARLRPGVAPQQTEALLAVLTRRLLQDFPGDDHSYGEAWRKPPSGLRLWCRPLRESMQNFPRFEEMRRTLFAFLAAIGFVLAIACANVANLTLARTERRRRELAIRAALGAGRARLMRQLLAENLLLAGLGGAVGLIFAVWGMKLFASFNVMPALRPVEIDGHVLAVALAASLLTGLLFGLAPAWTANRIPLNRALTETGQAMTGGRRVSRYRAVLVIGEIALAVILLTGAGLMIQSVVRLLQVNPGFDPANLVKVRLDFSGRNGLPAGASATAILEDAQQRLAAIPGVSAVGIVRDTYREEKATVESHLKTLSFYRIGIGVGAADFFRAARIPLTGGRYFDRADVGSTGGAVIVNETLARLAWPGENAVGKRFRLTERSGQPTCEVIGVVGDTRFTQLDEGSRAIYYCPYSEADLRVVPTLVVRTESDPALILPAIRRELKAVLPTMRQPWISFYRQTLYDATLAQRTYRNYLAIFAGIGLLLAALGVYGVLAYAVAQRTREIGIRMALGANRRAVVRMIVGEGGRLVAIGVVIGLLAAWWLTRFLQKQLYAVSPTDPAVMASVVVVLIAVGLFACWLPARRAARVDPMVALRAE